MYVVKKRQRNNFRVFIMTAVNVNNGSSRGEVGL